LPPLYAHLPRSPKLLKKAEHKNNPNRKVRTLNRPLSHLEILTN
jgi:hypothetical protein